MKIARVIYLFICIVNQPGHALLDSLNATKMVMRGVAVSAGIVGEKPLRW